MKAEASEAAEPEAVEEEPKPKRWKVKGTTKTRDRAKLKACEGNAHVPKYGIFRVPEYPTRCFTILVSLSIYSRFRYLLHVLLLCCNPSPQASGSTRTHCIFVRVALSILSLLAVFFPRALQEFLMSGLSTKSLV